MTNARTLTLSAVRLSHTFRGSRTPMSSEPQVRDGTTSATSLAAAGAATYDALAEEVLLARAREGDHAAFGEIVRRYQNAVFNLCYRMLGDYHEAEDAAQETFLRAFRHFHRFDTRRRFSTWLLSIASHYCIDRLRRRRVTFVSLDAPDVQRHRGHRVHPEEFLLQKEVADRVQAMLGQLTPDDRLVLILHYYYDMSYREIGEIMGLSEGAVKTRAHRARRALGKLLRSEGEEE